MTSRPSSWNEPAEHRAAPNAATTTTANASAYPKASAASDASVVTLPSARTDRRRHATVYDAIAGRVSATGFIGDASRVSGYERVKSSNLAVTPEAVLFRRRRAPIRYHEDDFYWANEALPVGSLPNSDLLKALHTYAADFYSRRIGTANTSTMDPVLADWQSMDETALLALGILMEEYCRHSLGDTGDLAFTEGEAIDGERAEK